MAKRDYLDNQTSGLSQFLQDYPRMQIVPSRTKKLVLRGTFTFAGKTEEGPEILDSFDLEINIPAEFPLLLPTVKEIANKIPRKDGFHINPDDTLCLGSPLRLLSLVQESSSIVGFAERCLIPYLYAIHLKLKEGGKLYMGELEHGNPGIITDYLELLNLKSKIEVLKALQLMGVKKRVANKKDCPCGCKKRLGQCLFRFKISKFREMTNRNWFKRHFDELSKR